MQPSNDREQPVTQVLLVGHCGFDAGSLQSFAQGLASKSPVTRINTQAQLDDHTDRHALLLVNRVLDGQFTQSTGIELIEAVASASQRCLLISNFQDAQQQARAVGAWPGFGKADMHQPQARERFLAAFQGSGDASP